MAVPKKRTSKSRKNLRKTVWKNKMTSQAVNARFKAFLLSAPTVLKEETDSKGFQSSDSPIET